MAIYIFCSACKGSCKVRDEYAGKQGKCPKCGNLIDIADSSEETQRSMPRPATKSQKEEAAALGVTHEPHITYIDLKEKLDKVRAAQPREAT